MLRRLLISSISIVALAAGSAGAQTLIPRPPERRPIPPPRDVFTIASQHVDVTVETQVARTVIEQTFVNHTRQNREATYLFPIPEKASISTFTMWMNGEEVEGEVVEANRARRIYEDIVRQMRDPGLLEYVGLNLFRARVYPVQANGEVKIRIAYEQVLEFDAGIVSYAYPLKTDACVGRIGEVSVAVHITASKRIRSLYSPTHDIDKRLRGRNASCGFEEQDTRPDADFVLYYAVSDEDVAVNVLTHRDDAGDGYFMMLMSPGEIDDASQAIPKDVVFVLDRSGSMKGEKIAQARDALDYCVRSLNHEDRFNIVAFSTTVTTLDEKLVGATRATRDRAINFIEDIRARGGTDIGAAIATALDLSDSERPQMLIFLTDGLPTVGEKDIHKLLADFRDRNRTGVRMFPFGVGHDVNTVLLDKMSEEHRGTVAYVRPEEDIEDRVSRFYDKVGNPVLADISVNTGDIRLRDVYPRTLPDIFSGSQLVLLGRYNHHGHTAVELTGHAGERELTYAYDADFARRNRDNAFIPRLWASRKIAYLLSELKTNGQDDELVGEVIELSLEHGIITPYTSYLILEEGSDEDRMRLGRSAPRGAIDAAAGSPVSDLVGRFMRTSESAAPELASGQAATEMSRSLAEEKARSVVRKEEVPGARFVGTKRFVLGTDGEWVDSAFERGMKVVQVKFLSDAYFDLLDEHGEVKRYLALGKMVTFVLDGTAYRVSP